MNNPIITSLLDNDVYTFSVCYLYLKQFPRAAGRYTFVDRNDGVYPPGFAQLLKEQFSAMKSIVITDEETEFMRRKCYYFPTWFFTFLKGYRFDANEVCVEQDADGHLRIEIEGLLWKTVFWEVPILAIISELSHMFDKAAERYNPEHEYLKSRDKGERMLRNGMYFAEFGTRRRFSFEHHDLVVRSLVEADKTVYRPTGNFTGTSNVLFAMRYDLTPIGTMSHQVISFCGAIFGYKEANYLAMDYWQETFDSDLGSYLYDTFGWNAFQENFSKKHAKLFEGLRVDSGDNFAAVDKISAKYRELGVDPLIKTLTFSNGLTVDDAVAIHDYCAGKIRSTFGIGTFLTCDVSGVKPLNIVIKLTAARLTEKKRWQKAIKLSDDVTKYTGDPDEVAFAVRALGIM